MRMNNKGKASSMAWFAIIFVVIATVAIIGLLYRSTQQQAVVIEKTVTGEGGVTPILGTGTAATYKLFTKDAQSDTLARVAVPITCWDKNDPTELLADAARTDPGSALTISGTNVNGVYVCEGFNATWYPVRDEYKIPQESVSRTVDVNIISRDVNITVYDKNGISFGVLNDRYNMSGMSSQATGTWDRIQIKNTDTDSMLNIKMIGFDVDANTNISKIEITGWESVDKPARLRTTLDYAFALPNSVNLKEFQKIETGTIQFTADGDGCTGPLLAENFVMYFIDESSFKSSKDNSIKTGVEDDQASPADVGRGDYTIPGRCTGGAA